jgi:polar amino acid transport system substrate-binding protein
MRLTLFALLSFLTWLPAAQAAETVTIVADSWCPYNCDPASDRPGYMIEIAKKAFRRHGIKVKYSNMPWTRAIEETRMFKHTAIVGASHKDAEDFVFPKASQGWMENTFYVKKDNKWYYSGEPALAKISLGAVADYSYGNPLDDYIGKNKNDLQLVQLVSGDNALDTNIKKLLAGRIDALVEDEHVMTYYLAQRSEAIRAQLKTAGSLPITEQNNLYIAFSPQAPDAQKYADILTKETEKMRKSGELKKILDRYSISDWVKK